jgi:predicted dehydrogenase
MNKSRRGFIKKTAIAAAGISMGAGFPTIDVKGTIIGANDRIRMGAIGVGNRGSQLLEIYMRNPDIQLTALCDIYKPYLMRDRQAVHPRYFIPERRPVPTMGEKFSKDVARYHDYRKLLEDKNVDAVCIATPDHWHALQTIDAVNAGKDVYLEKPVSITINEGRKIVEAAQRTKRIVTVGYIRRYSGLYQKVYELVKSGKLGEITLIDGHFYGNMTPNGIGNMLPEDPPADFDWDMWLGPRKYRPYQYNIAPYMFRWFKDFSSQIANQGSHFLDVIQWLTGENAPVAITATGSNHFIKDDRDIPENIEILYELASGRTIHFRVSETVAQPGLEYGYITLIGTQGCLYIADNGYKFFPSRPGQFQTWTLDASPEDVSMPRTDWAEWGSDHFKDFVDCIRTGKTPKASIEQSFRSSSFALLANISLAVKQRIEWDPMKEQVTNYNAANQLLQYEYRKPWKL